MVWMLLLFLAAAAASPLAWIVMFYFEAWEYHVISSFLRSLRGSTQRRVASDSSPKRPPCSLNGELTLYGSCICDAPWSGTNCSIMDFLPVSFPQGYGMKPNVTTWGGNAIFDGTKYHLFVAAMTNQCTLRDWTTNSRIDHAVSDRITGPYTFKDVAVNTWSHNPAPVVLPDGTYAIIHIGQGNGDSNGGKDCTNEVISNGVAQRRTEPSEGSTIHVSKSLNGPWEPLEPNTLGDCNNPSPVVHRNGTIFIFCGSSFKRAEQISGPWTDLTTIPISGAGGPPGNYEDPYLYIDRRGFHLLFHVYNTTQHPPHGHECIDSTVSAHAYSKDGFSWFFSPIQPYGTQIALASGETITMSTRERPKLFFDDMGRMTHLFNGVCAAPTCPSGPNSGCVDCKFDSWDYTLVAPLRME